MNDRRRPPKRKASVEAERAIERQRRDESDETAREILELEEQAVQRDDIIDQTLPLDGSFQLSNGVFQRILSFFTQKELVHRLSFVCKAWKQHARNPDLWTHLDANIWKTRSSQPAAFSSMKKFLLFIEQPQFCKLVRLSLPDQYRTLRRNIFDRLSRACPLIEELDMQQSTRLLGISPGRDEFERFPSLFPALKKLRLKAYMLKHFDIVKFAQQMGPRLEELHVHIRNWSEFSDATYISIAKACPNLTSFDYWDYSLPPRATTDQFSLESLKTILASCPKLQSLGLTYPRSLIYALFDYVEEWGYRERGVDFGLYLLDGAVDMDDVQAQD